MKRALILLAVMIMAVSMTTAVWAETLPEEGANVPADGTYEKNPMSFRMVGVRTRVSITYPGSL